MAKRKHGQSNYNCPRSRSPPHPSGFLVCPSLSILSILSTIATASQAVDGSPLPLPTPPPFLCPFIEHDNRALSSSSTIITSASPTSTLANRVADKYVQGNDSLWRKTDNWSLFGSTYSSTSSGLAATSPTAVPLNASQTQLLDSVLPAGWSPTSSSGNRTESIIILSLAIILAVSICVFMVSCIFWRRRRKKLSKKEQMVNDVELKTRHKENIEDPSDDEREREVRGKLHVWAKASARWKANIRHSARRRKNRRQAVSTGRLSRPQSPILTQACDASIPPSSPPASQRHSTASTEDSQVITTLPLENSSVTQPLPPPVLSSPHRVSSPPAYMSPAQHMRPMTEDCPQISHENSSGDPSRRKSLLFGLHDLPTTAEDDDIPYQPSYAGHVAIDDKAHLARLAGLASAPPVNEENTGEGSLAVHESAPPEWHDDPEELHFPGTTTTPLTSPISIPGFPAPPSKSAFSSRYFAEHSYLEDITSLDPITLPSMPPYEANPNTVSFEESSHASAPPLSDDDQAYEHWGSSAPEAFDNECSTPIASFSPLPDQACIGRNGTLPIYQP